MPEYFLYVLSEKKFQIVQKIMNVDTVESNITLAGRGKDYKIA
jgi:hypothetical protein